MDPSYNNSFGGNNSGVNPVPNPGATPPIGPAPAPVQSPAPMANLNSMPNPTPAPTPTPIQSPTPPSQFSSDSGDIIINSAPKSTKKIAPGIIALIVIVIILLFAGIAFLIINRNNGSSGSATPSAIKEAFNSYVNYVLYGKNSNENIEDIANFNTIITPYFESLDNEEKTQYISTAIEKYDSFTNLYYAEGRNLDDLIDTNSLQDYFQDYARIDQLGEADVLDLYNKYGKSETAQMIKKNYNITNISNNLAAYVDDLEELSDTYLNIIANIDNAGCLSNGSIIENCYTLTEAENNKIQIIFDVIDMWNSFYSKAINTLNNLYAELYQK